MIFSTGKSIPRRMIAIILLATTSVLFTIYVVWPPNSYFLKVLKNNTGIELSDYTRLPWKWASRPYGFPRLYSNRYVTAVIEGVNIDSADLPVELIEKEDCFTDSNPVKKFLNPGARIVCWGQSRSGRRQDNFFLLYAEEQNILFYKFRGR